MKKKVTQIDQLDLQSSIYTYADYLTWKLDEMVEIIKGKIFPISPAPNTYHQTLSVNLTGLLKMMLKGKSCRLFHAPTDVRLITNGPNDNQITTVVQPDLFIVCDPLKLDDQGCLGSPDFIIEILSFFNFVQRS